MSSVHTVNVWQAKQSSNGGIVLRLTPGSYGREGQEDVPDAFIIHTYKCQLGLARRSNNPEEFYVSAIDGQQSDVLQTLNYHAQRNLPLVWSHLWAEG